MTVASTGRFRLHFNGPREQAHIVAQRKAWYEDQVHYVKALERLMDVEPFESEDEESLDPIYDHEFNRWGI